VKIPKAIDTSCEPFYLSCLHSSGKDDTGYTGFG
jgi:hypothetical protein